VLVSKRRRLRKEKTKRCLSVTNEIESTLLLFSIPLTAKLELTSRFLWRNIVIHNFLVIPEISTSQ
jgi:hypothetical protein